MTRIVKYIRSPSTVLAVSIGIVMYLSYATALAGWGNPGLIAVCLFISGFLPIYARLSNKVEEKINLRFALVTLGRLARFALQLLFNIAIFAVFASSDLIAPERLTSIGGLAGVIILTTLASQGAQYVGIALFNRNIGDLNRNVLIGLSANIVVTAFAVAGVPVIQGVFLVASLGFGALVFTIGILSDLRGHFYPRRGVGLFFGTFNPFHATHLKLISQVIAERGLEKLYVHPTVVPKLHARALARGEIRVGRIEGGMAIYERTEKADVNVNYFPTGNRFYPPETRKLLIELAIADAGLTDKVEVLWLPDIYADHGFHGVVSAVRRRHPGQPLHGVHGSDLGGMWVRAIYDECGWIYPHAVRRRDGVSATAIRNGALGMASPIVQDILAQMRAGAKVFEIRQRSYRNDDGLITPA